MSIVTKESNPELWNALFEEETNNDFAKRLQIELLEKDKEIKRLNNILNDFNHRFAKIEGICNEMIKDRMYMNEYAIKRYAEEIKEIVFYYIIELKGDSSNE